ncbi:hypothetical protein EDD21DRAFT_372303 [Dissophora ornata]|nr:hypothetical protein EDD21DRAFT_372303 [Dissophora ornata]
MSDLNPWQQSGSHDTSDLTAPQSLSQNDLYPTTQQEQTHIDNTITQTEAPPSYETVITKDTPQIHNDYDHLRGPPGQRGQDVKARIPAESASSSYCRSEGSTSSGSSSEAGPSVPLVASQYHGSTSASNGITHSPTSTQAPNLGLTGQIALGPNDGSATAQGANQLLGASSGLDYDDEDDDFDRSCWSVAGEQRAWAALAYMLVVLLPWTLFCFIWTFTFALSAPFTMIFPPLGYLFTIFSVTSWRALARVDLVLASVLVSNKVRQRYPLFTAKVFVAPEPASSWKAPRVLGHEVPLPGFAQRELQRRHTSRSRRPKNIWHRAAKHLKATLNRHSISSMFYFIVWKMMFAIPVFIVVMIMFCLTIPFMVCLLPALLIMSRAFANWQYRWAVTWLSEKKAAPMVV